MFSLSVIGTRDVLTTVPTSLKAVSFRPASRNSLYIPEASSSSVSGSSGIPTALTISCGVAAPPISLNNPVASVTNSPAALYTAGAPKISLISSASSPRAANSLPTLPSGPNTSNTSSFAASTSLRSASLSSSSGSGQLELRKASLADPSSYGLLETTGSSSSSSSSSSSCS